MSQFITSAVADHWTGIHCKEEETVEPSFEDLKRWIGRLDAKTWTMVTINGRHEAFLTVGGGDGKYIVILTSTDEQFWNLISPIPNVAGLVTLNIGGQEGDYPGRQVVDYQTALKAAETFFSSGGMDSALTWEQET